jgi:hypothetical protein
MKMFLFGKCFEKRLLAGLLQQRIDPYGDNREKLTTKSPFLDFGNSSDLDSYETIDLPEI